jgi:hypothetical protein
MKLSKQQWKDNGLKWNKTEYNGIEEIRLPINRIWTPDVVLYNYADTRLEEKREVLCIVTHEGVVKWRPPSIFKSTCQINIQKFPYDQVNIFLKTYSLVNVSSYFELVLVVIAKLLNEIRKLDVRRRLDRHSVLREPGGDQQEAVHRV